MREPIQASWMSGGRSIPRSLSGTGSRRGAAAALQRRRSKQRITDWTAVGARGLTLPSRSAVLEDLEEAAAAELLERHAGGERLVLGQGAAVDAAEEEVEEALAG